MSEINQLNDFDQFFYYGSIPQELEMDSDIVAGVVQQKRTMFYNRSFGAGLGDYEGHPNNLLLQIQLRYDIASFIANRNLVVSDGSDGMRDRRIAVSQFSIDIETDGETINVVVYYIPYYKSTIVNKVTI